MARHAIPMLAAPLGSIVIFRTRVLAFVSLTLATSWTRTVVLVNVIDMFVSVASMIDCKINALADVRLSDMVSLNRQGGFNTVPERWTTKGCLIGAFINL